MVSTPFSLMIGECHHEQGIHDSSVSLLSRGDRTSAQRSVATRTRPCKRRDALRSHRVCRADVVKSPPLWHGMLQLVLLKPSWGGACAWSPTGRK